MDLSSPNLDIGTNKPRRALRAVKMPERVTRREFLDHFRKNYSSGNHVTFIGPTQRGKTTLAHQMLGKVASKDRKATILAGKPPKRDPVMAAAAKKLRMRRVSS